MSKVQKLILPINRAKLTASMYNEAYRKRFGFTHYGIDMVSVIGDKTVYACGDGKVLATGNDNILGNFAIIRYDNIQFTDNKTKTVKCLNVVCRMFHFRAVYCKRGDLVTKDTVIGAYSNTGAYSAGNHLHMEFDTDVTYIFYTPTLSGASTYFTGSKYGANASTMLNPIDLLFCKKSRPDCQTYTTADDAYINPADKIIDNWTLVN